MKYFAPFEIPLLYVLSFPIMSFPFLCHPRHRKAQESQKEMKLLLDMYRSAPKEQRDKVQLMAAEKKSKAEVIYPAMTCHLG